MKTILGWAQFLGGVIWLTLAFWAMIAYVKGHFDRKYFWIYWLYTAFFIYMYYYGEQQQAKEVIDTRPGYILWEEKMKDFDPVRGY